ncbi:isopentenyl-diphosphate delta-isomerase [Striga asiatica]|uniref:Isopentenyl-diphosphate delta-isomerase n=1 Tax=Striga asiatica TaxID=4170 RepID=A0A5A7QZM6_STRAF|nr:isopentenyl-diphosphate delta-isomerase [Striga asiatica]
MKEHFEMEANTYFNRLRNRGCSQGVGSPTKKQNHRIERRRNRPISSQLSLRAHLAYEKQREITPKSFFFHSSLDQIRLVHQVGSTTGTGVTEQIYEFFASGKQTLTIPYLRIGRTPQLLRKKETQSSYFRKVFKNSFAKFRSEG